MSKSYSSGNINLHLPYKDSDISLTKFTDASFFRNKSILISGNPGTGKTVVVKHFLADLYKQTPNIFIITPISSQPNYPQVLSMYMRSKISPDFLSTLLQIQEKKSILRNKILGTEKWILFVIFYLCTSTNSYKNILNKYEKTPTKEVLNALHNTIIENKKSFLDVFINFSQSLINGTIPVNDLIKKLSFMPYFDEEMLNSSSDSSIQLNIMEEMKELYIGEINNLPVLQLASVLKYLQNALINLITNIEAVLIIEDMTQDLKDLEKAQMEYFDQETNKIQKTSILKLILTRSRHFKLTTMVIAHTPMNISGRSLYHAYLSTDNTNAFKYMTTELEMHKKDSEIIIDTVFKLYDENPEENNYKYIYVGADPLAGSNDSRHGYFCANFKLTQNLKNYDVSSPELKDLFNILHKERKKDLNNDL